MKIFIVIPAYNEKNIFSVVDQTCQYGKVVVVDDGTTEAPQLAGLPLASGSLRKLETNGGMVLLEHIINRGQGAALQTGIDFALSQGADIIVTMDSDGQHLASEIPMLIAPIKRGEADIVLGSRFLKTRIDTDCKTDSHRSQININIPWMKKWLILRPAIWFERIFTGLKLTDAHQGFRAMSRMAAEKIKITQDRMAHATEIASEIKRNKLRYTEVPVTVIYNEFGQGFSGAWKIFKDLVFRRIVY